MTATRPDPPLAEAPATARASVAVIPAAGLGTRLLPATKAIPKELLLVGDRPAIQHTVEEAVAAGFDEIVLVTRPAKHAIEDHFDRDPELELHLAAAGRGAELLAIRRASALADIRVVHQVEPRGLGHALGAARRAVGDRSFAVLLPDELIVDGGALLGRLADQHQRRGWAAIGLVQVPRDQIGQYGCAALDPPVGAFAGLVGGPIRALVEKPDPDSAPSDLAVCGRYVLGPDVFDRLDAVAPDASGEIQLTVALAELARAGRLDGVVSRARRYDLGRRLDLLLANLDLAVEDPALAAGLAEHLARWGGTADRRAA